MQHVVIGKAFRFAARSSKAELEGYHFDSRKGFWIEDRTGIPLVHSADGPKPGTKKADIETGEDKKGQ